MIHTAFTHTTRIYLGAAAIFCTVSLSVSAQNISINGTGNPADASSMLDVSAGDKGLLIPRVALTATNAAGPVTSPAVSLMVYNTATAGTAPNNVVPGYYYWDGTQWVQVATALSTKNLYTANGSLTGPRTVNVNGNSLTFQDNTQTFGGQTGFSYANGARFTQSTTTGRADIILQAGGSAINLFQDVNNASQFITSGTSTALAIGTGTAAATPIQFYTGGTRKMIITGSGNIGIGPSGPDASALLDLNGSTQGFLAPRVALTANNVAGPITSPATSLLVYNTATAGTAPNNVVPGYYYWDGSQWVQFRSSSNTPNAWSLTGNSGTSAATNFVGTADATDFVTRTNNTEKMRVTGTGNIGINNTSPIAATSTATNTATSGSTVTLAVNGTVDAPVYVSPVQTLTDAATVSWDVTLGSNAVVTLAGNRTLSISNAKKGMYGTVIVKQDATGSRTLALPSGSKVINGGSGAVNLSQPGNSADILVFYWDGTNYWWTLGTNYN